MQNAKSANNDKKMSKTADLQIYVFIKKYRFGNEENL